MSDTPEGPQDHPTSPAGSGNQRKETSDRGPQKIRIKLDPQLASGTGGRAAPAASLDPSRSLDDLRTERLEAELEELKRLHAERKDLHGLRTKHAWLLFGLTVVWILFVWLVVLLQGFGQWFFSYPELKADEFHLKFALSDSTLIAFMTTTTTTVLGLYGIAAYWMYKGGKAGNDNDQEDKKNADSRARPKGGSENDDASGPAESG